MADCGGGEDVSLSPRGMDCLRSRRSVDEVWHNRVGVLRAECWRVVLEARLEVAPFFVVHLIDICNIFLMFFCEVLERCGLLALELFVILFVLYSCGDFGFFVIHEELSIGFIINIFCCVNSIDHLCDFIIDVVIPIDNCVVDAIFSVLHSVKNDVEVVLMFVESHFHLIQSLKVEHVSLALSEEELSSGWVHGVSGGGNASEEEFHF